MTAKPAVLSKVELVGIEDRQQKNDQPNVIARAAVVAARSRFKWARNESPSYGDFAESLDIWENVRPSLQDGPTGKGLLHSTSFYTALMSIPHCCLQGPGRRDGSQKL